MHSSVYIALVHEVLKLERFWSLADLTEEVKVKLREAEIEISTGRCTARSMPSSA